MSWVITGREAGPADPFIGSVSLLLHGNGTNGSTTITDNSPTPKTVTAVGNAQISTTQSKFGGASIAFDGNGDYLTAPYGTAFQLKSSDFTVECWIYINQYKSRDSAICGVYSYLNDAPQSWLMFFTSTGSLRLRIEDLGNIGGTGDVLVVNTGANVIPIGQWSHVAVTRQGSNFRAFIDGTQHASASNSFVIDDGNGAVPLSIGGLVQGASESQSMDGYIDDLRITKGIARYTANFTPPTAPFPDI